MNRNHPELNFYAINLRRLMARLDLTMEQVVVASGLSERTVKGLLGGRSKPHPRTLHRLAAALGVVVDEFFWPSGEFRPWRPQITSGEIRCKIDSVLASDQRDLLIELVEVLSRHTSQSTRDHDPSIQPRVAVISPD